MKTKQVVIQRLKCTSNHFIKVLEGKKQFEIRIDDGRKFTTEDIYILDEIGIYSKEYTGRFVIFTSNYILENFKVTF